MAYIINDRHKDSSVWSGWMNRRSPHWRTWVKTITLLVSASFLFPYMAFAFEASTYPAQAEKFSFLANGKPVEVSAGLGRVVSSFRGKSGKTVIYIHDLHCNYEVQSNIAALLDKLAQKNGLKLIGVEGESRPIDVSALASFPRATVKVNTGQYFMKRGRITGAEYLAATGHQPLVLQGIEDQALYDQNKNTLLKFLNEESQGYCEDLKSIIEKLKTPLYSTDLAKLDHFQEQFEGENVSLETYCRFLLEQAKKQGLSLGSFPQMELFAQENRVPAAADSDYGKLADNAAELDQAVRERLYTSNDQRQLDHYSALLKIVANMLTISATAKELEYYRAHSAEFSVTALVGFLDNLCYRSGMSSHLDTGVVKLDEYLKLAAQFYTVADKRSDAFVQNTLQQMDLHQQKIAVLITGGYHDSLVEAAFKKRGVSFLTIKPRITHTYDENPYFSQLRNRRARAEELLTQNQKNFALSSAFNDKRFVGFLQKVVGMDMFQELMGKSHDSAAFQEALVTTEGAQALAEQFEVSQIRSNLQQRVYALPLKNSPYTVVLRPSTAVTDESASRAFVKTQDDLGNGYKFEIVTTEDLQKHGSQILGIAEENAAPQRLGLGQRLALALFNARQGLKGLIASWQPQALGSALLITALLVVTLTVSLPPFLAFALPMVLFMGLLAIAYQLFTNPQTPAWVKATVTAGALLLFNSLLQHTGPSLSNISQALVNIFSPTTGAHAGQTGIVGAMAIPFAGFFGKLKLGSLFKGLGEAVAPEDDLISRTILFSQQTFGFGNRDFEGTTFRTSVESLVERLRELSQEKNIGAEQQRVIDRALHDPQLLALLAMVWHQTPLVPASIEGEPDNAPSPEQKVLAFMGDLAQGEKLAELLAAGKPVPPGMVLGGNSYLAQLLRAVAPKVQELEALGRTQQAWQAAWSQLPDAARTTELQALINPAVSAVAAVEIDMADWSPERFRKAQDDLKVAIAAVTELLEKNKEKLAVAPGLAAAQQEWIKAATALSAAWGQALPAKVTEFSLGAGTDALHPERLLALMAMGNPAQAQALAKLANQQGIQLLVHGPMFNPILGFHPEEAQVVAAYKKAIDVAHALGVPNVTLQATLTEAGKRDLAAYAGENFARANVKETKPEANPGSAVKPQGAKNAWMQGEQLEGTLSYQRLGKVVALPQGAVSLGGVPNLVWQMESGQMVPRELDDKRKWDDVAALPGDEGIMAVNGNGKAMLWLRGQDGRLNTQGVELTGASHGLRAVSPVPGGQGMLAVGSKGEAVVWFKGLHGWETQGRVLNSGTKHDLSEALTVKTAPGKNVAVVMGDQGRVLAAYPNPATGAPEFQPLLGASKSKSSALALPNGGFVARGRDVLHGDQADEVVVWYPGADGKLEPQGVTLLGVTRPLNNLVLLPNGKGVMATGHETLVWYFGPDGKLNPQAEKLPGLEGEWFGTLAALPNQAGIMGVGELNGKGRAAIWLLDEKGNVKPGSMILEGGEGPLTSLAVIDNEAVVATGDKGNARMWRIPATLGSTATVKKAETGTPQTAAALPEHQPGKFVPNAVAWAQNQMGYGLAGEDEQVASPALAKEFEGVLDLAAEEPALATFIQESPERLALAGMVYHNAQSQVWSSTNEGASPRDQVLALAEDFYRGEKLAEDILHKSWLRKAFNAVGLWKHTWLRFFPEAWTLGDAYLPQLIRAIRKGDKTFALTIADIGSPERLLNEVLSPKQFQAMSQLAQEYGIEIVVRGPEFSPFLASRATPEQISRAYERAVEVASQSAAARLVVTAELTPAQQAALKAFAGQKNVSLSFNAGDAIPVKKDQYAEDNNYTIKLPEMTKPILATLSRFGWVNPSPNGRNFKVARYKLQDSVEAATQQVRAGLARFALMQSAQPVDLQGSEGQALAKALSPFGMIGVADGRFSVNKEKLIAALDAAQKRIPTGARQSAQQQRENAVAAAVLASVRQMVEQAKGNKLFDVALTDQVDEHGLAASGRDKVLLNVGLVQDLLAKGRSAQLAKLVGHEVGHLLSPESVVQKTTSAKTEAAIAEEVQAGIIGQLMAGTQLDVAAVLNEIAKVGKRQILTGTIKARRAVPAAEVSAAKLVSSAQAKSAVPAAVQALEAAAGSVVKTVAAAAVGMVQPGLPTETKPLRQRISNMSATVGAVPGWSEGTTEMILEVKNQRERLIGPGYEDFSRFEELYQETRSILDRLLNVEGLELGNYDLFLVDSMQPNASVMPHDGKVFITLGLLKMLAQKNPSTDAIAAVLAHELVHVRQHLQDVAAGKAQAKQGLVISAMTGRAREYQSDLAALSLMDQAGFSVKDAPAALRGLMEWMQERKLKDSSFGTHPQLEERVRKLERYILEHHWVNFFKDLQPLSRDAKNQAGERTRYRMLQDQVIHVKDWKKLWYLLHSEAHSADELQMVYLVGMEMLPDSERETGLNELNQIFEERSHAFGIVSAGSQMLSDFMGGQMRTMVLRLNERGQREKLAQDVSNASNAALFEALDIGVPGLFIAKFDMDPQDQDETYKKADFVLEHITGQITSMGNRSMVSNRFSMYTGRFLDIISATFRTRLQEGKATFAEAQRLFKSLNKIAQQAGAMNLEVYSIRNLNYAVAGILQEQFGARLTEEDALEILGFYENFTGYGIMSYRQEEGATAILTMALNGSLSVRRAVENWVRSGKSPLREIIKKMDAENFFDGKPALLFTGSPQDLDNILAQEELSALYPKGLENFLRDAEKRVSPQELIAYHKKVLAKYGDFGILNTMRFKAEREPGVFDNDAFEQALLEAVPEHLRNAVKSARPELKPFLYVTALGTPPREEFLFDDFTREVRGSMYRNPEIALMIAESATEGRQKPSDLAEQVKNAAVIDDQLESKLRQRWDRLPYERTLQIYARWDEINPAPTPISYIRTAEFGLVSALMRSVNKPAETVEIQALFNAIGYPVRLDKDAVNRYSGVWHAFGNSILWSLDSALTAKDGRPCNATRLNQKEDPKAEILKLFDFLDRLPGDYAQAVSVVQNSLLPSVFRNFVLQLLFVDRVLNRQYGAGLSREDALDLKKVQAAIGRCPAAERAKILKDISLLTRGSNPMLVHDKATEDANKAALGMYASRKLFEKAAPNEAVIRAEHAAESRGYENAFYTNLGGPLAQLNLFASRMADSLLAEALAKPGSWEQQLQLIMDLYPEKTPSRDRWLKQLVEIHKFQAPSSVLALFANTGLRDNLALRMLDELREAHPEYFETLDQSLAVIQEYFSDPSPTRDDILEATAQDLAKTPSEYQLVKQMLVDPFKSPEKAVDKSSAQVTFVHDAFRAMIKGLTPTQKSEALLWLIGLTEKKPFFLVHAEYTFHVKFDEIRSLYASGQSRFYPDAGTTAHREALEPFLYGDSGLLTDLGASKQFMDQLFQAVVPAGGSYQKMLKAMYDAAFEQADPARREEMFLALTRSLALESQAETGLTDEAREAKTIRVFLQSMGMVGVKVGQFLGSSPLISPVLRQELSQLKDRARNLPKGIVFDMVEKLFGPFADTFEEIDEPLGGGSMGVVYRARLKSGRLVALKLKRPDVEKQADESLAFMHRVMDAIRPALEEAGVPVPKRLLSHIEQVIREELDFDHEFKNGQRLRQNITAPSFTKRAGALIFNFVASLAWPASKKKYSFSVPEPIAVVKNSALLQELVEGTPLTAEDQLRAQGEDVADLQRGAVREFFRQLFVDGFYHADPHAGNIMKGAGNTMYLLDLGAASEISFRSRQILMEIFSSVSGARRNTESLASLIQSLGGKITEELKRSLQTHVVESQESLTSRLMWFFQITEDFNVPLPEDLFRVFRFLGAGGALFEITEKGSTGPKNTGGTVAKTPEQPKKPELSKKQPWILKMLRTPLLLGAFMLFPTSIFSVLSAFVPLDARIGYFLIVGAFMTVVYGAKLTGIMARSNQVAGMAAAPILYRPFLALLRSLHIMTARDEASLPAAQPKFSHFFGPKQWLKDARLLSKAPLALGVMLMSFLAPTWQSLIFPDNLSLQLALGFGLYLLSLVFRKRVDSMAASLAGDIAPAVQSARSAVIRGIAWPLRWLKPGAQPAYQAAVGSAKASPISDEDRRNIVKTARAISPQANDPVRLKLAASLRLAGLDLTPRGQVTFNTKMLRERAQAALQRVLADKEKAAKSGKTDTMEKINQAQSELERILAALPAADVEQTFTLKLSDKMDEMFHATTVMSDRQTVILNSNQMKHFGSNDRFKLLKMIVHEMGHVAGIQDDLQGEISASILGRLAAGYQMDYQDVVAEIAKVNANKLILGETASEVPLAAQGGRRAGNKPGIGKKGSGPSTSNVPGTKSPASVVSVLEKVTGQLAVKQVAEPESVQLEEMANLKKLSYGMVSNVYTVNYKGKKAALLLRKTFDPRGSDFKTDPSIKEIAEAGEGVLKATANYQAYAGIIYDNHPVAPEVFAVVRNAQGHIVGYLTEFLEGKELDELASTGAISDAQLEEALKQLRGQLDLIHGKNLLHGDPRPENIIVNIRADGTIVARFIDFWEEKGDWTKAEDDRLFQERVVNVCRHAIQPEVVAATLTKRKAREEELKNQRFLVAGRDNLERAKIALSHLQAALGDEKSFAGFAALVRGMRTALRNGTKETRLYTVEDFRTLQSKLAAELPEFTRQINEAVTDKAPSNIVQAKAACLSAIQELNQLGAEFFQSTAKGNAPEGGAAQGAAGAKMPTSEELSQARTLDTSEQGQVAAVLRLAGLTLQGSRATFDKAFLDLFDQRLARLARGVASLPLMRNLRAILAQAQGKSFEIRVADDMDVLLPAYAENGVLYLNNKHFGRIAGRSNPLQLGRLLMHEVGHAAGILNNANGEAQAGIFARLAMGQSVDAEVVKAEIAKAENTEERLVLGARMGIIAAFFAWMTNLIERIKAIVSWTEVIFQRVPGVQRIRNERLKDEITFDGIGQLKKVAPATGNEEIDWFLFNLFTRYANSFQRDSLLDAYAELRGGMLANSLSGRDVFSGIEKIFSRRTQKSIIVSGKLLNNIRSLQYPLKPSEISADLRYKRILAQGSTAIIVLVTDLRDGREKVLKLQMNGNNDFINEQNILTDLAHVPSLVEIDGRYDKAILMAYVQGNPLGEYRASHKKLPAQTYRALLDYAREVAQRGYLIKDLHGDNVFLAPDGKITFIDVGSYRKYNGSELTVMEAIAENIAEIKTKLGIMEVETEAPNAAAAQAGAAAPMLQEVARQTALGITPQQGPTVRDRLREALTNFRPRSAAPASLSLLIPGLLRIISQLPSILRSGLLNVLWSGLLALPSGGVVWTLVLSIMGPSLTAALVAQAVVRIKNIESPEDTAPVIAFVSALAAVPGMESTAVMLPEGKLGIPNAIYFRRALLHRLLQGQDVPQLRRRLQGAMDTAA